MALRTPLSLLMSFVSRSLSFISLFLSLIPLLVALTSSGGCVISPYRDEAIRRVRESCNDQAVSTRDVTAAHEDERREACTRTRSTEDCTPIPQGAAWIRTDACRHAERWLCRTTTDGAMRHVTCERDNQPVIDTDV